MDMSIREEVLNYLISTNLVENYAKKLGTQQDFKQFDDTLQELWLQICEIPEQKWIDLLQQGTEKDRYTKCRAYCSGVLHRSIHSNSSRLYNKLKKYKKFELLEDDNAWDKLNQIPDNNMLPIDLIYAEETE